MMIRALFKRYKFHPRRWLLGLISYSRFIGYIRPSLGGGKGVDYRIWRKLFLNAWEPRELSFPVGKRILAISPHSDDEAIGAGGLLWAHRDVADIHIVLVTDGAAYGADQREGQTLEEARAKLVEDRKNELRKTADALRAKSLSFLDLPDRGIVIDDGSVAKLRKVLDEINPDVVLLPWFLDNHPDHRSVNRLFARACANRNPLVLGYEIWAVLDPNAYFDITDQLDAKIALIENYTTQIGEVDYMTFARGLAWVRGYQLIQKHGRKAAEAFVALPAEDYRELVDEVL
jgi:LmbE family N-acetylglucosaminyl deacetylase